MALGETKLPYESDYSFKGFDVFLENKQVGPHGYAHGGVAILAKHHTAPIRVRLNTNFQAVAVSAKLHRRITICSIYIPPGPEGEFDERDLEALLRQLPKPYLLLGDLNAHNTLWYSKSICGRGKKIEDVLVSNDCFFLDKNKDTHFHSHEGRYLSSHIDLSIASLDLLLDFEWGLYDDSMGSDHFPVWLRAEKRSRPHKFPKWIIDKADWEKFSRNAVPEINPDEFQSAREMGQYTTSFIIDAAKNSIPKTSGKGREYSAIWFNSECREAKRSRQDVFNKYKMGQATRAEWKKEEAKAQGVFQRNKRKSWNKFVDSLKGDESCKDMWRKVGILTNKFKDKEVSALKVDGRVIDDSEEIANSIAKEMEQVSSEGACSAEFLRHKRRAERKNINFASNEQQTYNVPISREELDSALKDLKDTAPGPDDIHNRMLKNLSEEAKEFLLKLLNKIFLDKEFPEEWRLAHIIPILKEGKDPLDPSSYRPISLTSCLCKLFEKIMARRIIAFLNSCELLNLAQNGARKGRSTIDSLVALENEVHEAFVRNRLLVCIFIDLMKAYDTCWGYLILQELHSAGLRGNLGFLIAGFMKNRTFQVRVGNKLSKVHKLELGIPQGSVLSVTLFMVAVNTVVRYVSSSVSRSLYVDDMRFSMEVHNLRTAEKTLNLLCRKLATWMNETGFRISLTKTKVMVFHNRTHQQLVKNPVLDFTLDIKIGDTILEVVREYKFLGIIFDQKLDWGLHIGALRRRCMSALGILKLLAKHNKSMKREAYIKIYKAIVLSKLDYGCQVYGTAKKYMLEKLDPIHHAGLRICTGAFRSSNRESLYVESFVPSLWDRRKFLNMCYMFRAQRIPSEDRLCAWENDFLDERYERLKSKPKSFGYLTRIACQEFQIDKPSIVTFREYEIPPWILEKIQVCMELGLLCKADTNPEVYRQFFAAHKHVSQIEIYTDGSKMNTKAGSGIYISGDGLDDEISIPLFGLASVFTAELVAIKMALVKIRQVIDRTVTLYSDSYSALQALMAFKSENKLVQEIQELIYELDQRRVVVIFCWIPSHVGIMGNERADKLAKAALELEKEGQPRVFFSDFKSFLKEKVFSSWKDRWKDMVDDRWTQLRGVQDIIKPRKWGDKLTRGQEVKITRLRIGHTKFARDFYYKDGIQPECIECGEFLTVQHVLLECGNFYRERNEYFKDRVISLSNLLNNPENFRPVLEFFKSIDMYDLI